LHQDRRQLTRTFTDRHGLKDLCKDLLGVELSKEQQSSDWGAGDADGRAGQVRRPRRSLPPRIARRLDVVLAREGRTELAQACFTFLPFRSELDLGGWDEPDIFRH